MCRLCIYCIYIYIIRVYTLEPPPSNRTHSVHVSEGLSITVSLVLQGIGGDRTQSSFFYCRSQVTLVYNMYWSDQHFFGRLIFHFMVKTSKHITQAMGHLGSRCISCISYIYIYIYLRHIHICLPTWLTSTVHPDYMTPLPSCHPLFCFVSPGENRKTPPLRHVGNAQTRALRGFLNTWKWMVSSLGQWPHFKLLGTAFLV